jgi:periplasmic copper chaperone A
MSRNRKVAVATAIATLAIPAGAQAHVTLQPNAAPAGAFTVLDVRVPTERDNASTSKVDVQFPSGFASASYQAVPGWKVRVIKKKLATPIQTDDGPITEGVSRMVWTRTSRGGGIKPGQFQDFPISVQIPGKAGDKLTFKALQTYTGGEVVRWIGGEGSDNPAPIVSVTSGDQAAATPAPTQAAATPAAQTSADDSGNGLAIVALIVGVLGLLVGGAGLLAARRASGRSGVAA